ncbi:hypothetical protein K503DRAFT_719288 [Rhizopogon vinicolor AM-OR11-026]|uniref:PCI domain-containing protein n=1 Tax=Rhizopogon vinicolor AM-OR11-026 TaxID=1314800 RepID=A0A1B7MYT2_9AGAM|nr:hypothetical protein K503DRAFT_719288 [Rhizopogon vinicolor AM-OR11-026]
MELGTNFTAKLEPFLLISKSAKGAAAAKLVQDATSAPGVFVFAELLELPNIQELANNEQHAPFFSLLQLFSYRTYKDYLENKDSLPQLNQAQITKLKHLSIVSLAANRRILPYSLLLQELQMPTIRDLEDLIIDAIFLDILRGKLDQKEQQLEIEYTMGRDLEPGKAESVLAALKAWASTTASVLSALDTKLEQIASYSAAVTAETEEHDRVYNSILRDVFDRQKDTKKRGPLTSAGNIIRGGGVSELADAMDVDEEPRTKGRKNQMETALKQQRKRNRF